MLTPWTTKSSRYLLKRWWMNLREDHVVLPDGRELPEFHVVEYPDWTCVVCLTPDGRYVMVEQYRHGIGQVGLEFASGTVDEGETPLEGARRELLEETGFAAEDWFDLGRCAPEPSKHTNWAHLFVAMGARPISQPKLDEGEDLRVCLLEPAELAAATRDGRLVHGIHLAALWRAREAGLLTGF